MDTNQEHQTSESPVLKAFNSQSLYWKINSDEELNETIVMNKLIDISNADENLTPSLSPIANDTLDKENNQNLSQPQTATNDNTDINKSSHDSSKKEQLTNELNDNDIIYNGSYKLLHQITSLVSFYLLLLCQYTLALCQYNLALYIAVVFLLLFVSRRSNTYITYTILTLLYTLLG